MRALIVQENSVPYTLGLSIGGPAKGEDVEAVLGRAAAERGGWPLVVQMDNGPANKAKCVLERLEREQVVALWNLPRTPQHNPRTERGIGTLKRALGSEALLGAAERGGESTQGPVSSLEPGLPGTRALLRARLEAARELLDARVPRASLGGRTPRELDSQSTRADHRICRARFYADVCSELARVQRAHENARARRMAERDTIWNALQRYGLVTRTRGGRPVPARKPEGVL